MYLNGICSTENCVNQDEIEAIVNAAVATLYEQDAQAIQFDVAERMLSARLAALLSPAFPDHSVHAEYNRHGVEPKGIEMPDAQGKPTFKLVYPDIIVHRPGTDDDNLLVIEMKKSTNGMKDEQDLEKLDRIKYQLGYSYALFLRLSAGEGASVENAYHIWR